MRVYISVDMEGLAGVSHDAPTSRGDRGYDAAVELMVGEANAAIEGAFEAGATEVVVNDSHGSMFNLPPARLDRRAVLVQGQKPWSMVEAAQPQADGGPSFGVALFVGYHARAGHPRGAIAHTYSGAPTLTTLNGRPVGEAGINAAVLGQWRIPVGLVTGDDTLAIEIEEWLPWAVRVVVKDAVSRRAAASVHPATAADRVREGASQAVRRAADGRLELLELGPPVVIETEFSTPGQADQAAIVPGCERYGDRGVRVSAPDAMTAYRAFLAGIRIVSGND